MSALPLKADMRGATSDVRHGPIADIGVVNSVSTSPELGNFAAPDERSPVSSDRIALGLDRSGDKAAQRGITQTARTTFALGGGFEQAFGQRAFLHRGSLLWPKGGPRIIQGLPQEGYGFRIKRHRGFAKHGHLSSLVLVSAGKS